LNILKFHANSKSKKIIDKRGLHYTRIDASKNGSMLYFGEEANMNFSKKCKTYRWKEKKRYNWCYK